ncbi:unnamed protein product [Wuchereria bancrofti]|uniref:Uncharacterized protein n=1 Tax=Wuchereria bancrofti TaxID=6293 RepID=A0A3P7DT82_WUCBA|nr:unnamed protein product [Wuchereria bancrofti]
MLAILLVRGLTLPGAELDKCMFEAVNNSMITIELHSISLGFVVFSILGYMSVIVDKNIAEIVKPGPGLAFLAYPEVASNLPLKQVWSMLFFLMITILGLDSQICMLEGLYTALEDVFPHFLRKYKKTSLALTCLFFFILGIPMVTYVRF